MDIDDQCKKMLDRESWKGSMDLAAKLGIDWRSVAAALRRLVRAGAVEQMMVDVPGSSRLREQKRVFRLAPPGARVVRFH